MPDVEAIVMSTVRVLLERRNAGDGPLGRDADLYDEIGLDSLEVAELSAVLEDDLGSDPYSEGLVPRTIAEIVSFYKAS